ncbi:helicase-related protein [Flavobacterium coralii]|uniref:helicase-related protein n=1 Tax=Flavobacterium coralii TaxID=2838017 RepID=UPI0032B2851E|tara:strand:+ start:66404 stop:69670 length:3267 start_codon:yes stop_codon:yes gene_type:complete
MSTKFFTNENHNTLLSKIEGIFRHRNIYFFDALVGYFRASGYFRIRPFVEKASEIRILVGINIDNLVFEANKRGLLFIEDPAKSRDDFFEEVKKNIQEAEYDKEVEDGMFGLIKDLAIGKIRIKVHPKQNLHAKIYIFREQEKHSHGYGSVITGSSNLTDNGLSRNFEFNVELRDNTDIDFATDTFDKLWDESIEIGQEFVEKLKKETYLNDEFTPFEVYMKFLIEYFGRSVDFDPNSIQDLPHGFKKLSYQVDAVADGYNKMMKHQGFFLSDVVGLGKTIVATLIAKKFFYSNGFPSYLSKTLIICPPALKENWEDTLSKFGLHNYKIVTSGSLHKVTKHRDYDLVIVDEAHKFRSDSAEMYFHLQNICKSHTRKRLPDGTYEQKRVMLISATPLNNRPEDIANLVYLFQDAKSSTLEVGNLQHFFRGQIDAYKKLKSENDIQKVTKGVKSIYEKIRVKVIEPLTVRRTRTDLSENEEYAKDLKEQGVIFPAVNKPEKIFYQLDEYLDSVYDKTILYLSHPTKGLSYNRYQAIKFLKPHKKSKYPKADQTSNQLAFIMKTMLVKRIDSSFYAFKQSLNRFSAATNAMVKMFENDRIYIAPNVGVNDYINEGKEEELITLLTDLAESDPTIEICSSEDFEPGFVTGLKTDKALLDELVKDWASITQDPKLDEFKKYLETTLLDKSINKEEKLVVFSESKETTAYLSDELTKSGFDKILVVDSKTRKDRFPAVKANFDANIPLTDQKDDYNIVISTEVLAEGVNMHRANIIVNYDTPWNSTRLMQRIGRVNRIGSKANNIHIFNFFPTAKVNNDIELEKKAIMKLQAFHSAMGEDSQIYSQDEETESFGLFDKTVNEEKDEKLRILLELRKFKRDNPDLFKQIKNMPSRARVGRKSPILTGATITFIRNEKRDAFLLVKDNGKIDELTFLQAEREYYAKVTEKAIPLNEYHHEQVKSAIHLFTNMLEEEKSRERKIDTTQGPNEKRALAFLDALTNVQIANPQEKELLQNAKTAIRLGKFQHLQRDINKLSKAVKTTPLKPSVLLEEVIKILNKYPLVAVEDDSVQLVQPIFNLKEFKPEIIISESFNH